jgi:Pseudomurein endo-isopeptidase Pei.
MTEKVEHAKYVDAVERTLAYVFEHGKIPNYTTVEGKQVLKNDIYDACKRDNAFYVKKGYMPTYVNILLQESAPVSTNPVKTDLLKRIEKAVGGEFKTATQFYNLVKVNDTYSHYSNDIYPQGQALTRLENRQGLNCADFSQIGHAAILELNKVYGTNYGVDYVHVACKSSSGAYNIGHIILRVKGEEFKNWTVFDVAEAASAGKAIGSTMCSLGYKVLSYNDSWLMSDDGET